MVTTATMLPAAIPVAYAVEQPSSGKRKLTSMRSGWGVFLKPGRVDQRPNNHKTRVWVERG